MQGDVDLYTNQAWSASVALRALRSRHAGQHVEVSHDPASHLLSIVFTLSAAALFILLVAIVIAEIVD